MKIKFQHIAGIVLVLIGLQITISNLDAIGNQAQSIGSAVFYVVLGGFFLYLYLQGTAQKWMLVVTIAALGLALVQVLGLVLFDEIYVSPISVIVVGSFLLAIMLVDQNLWLVLIPGFLLIALGLRAGACFWEQVWLSSSSIFYQSNLERQAGPSCPQCSYWRSGSLPPMKMSPGSLAI
ncbi:MAG: hypothetical protein P8Y68_20815 [Anaerolineales bacterium]